MEIKTIADLKAKLIKAIGEINTSKLTLLDLKLLADTVNVLANIDDKPFDFIEACSKISTFGFGQKQNTLSDFKEGK